MSKSFLSEPGSKSSALKRQILSLYLQNDSYSIADISDEIGISIPTSTKLVQELIAEGFLQDMGKQGTTGGRRPSIYGLNPEAGYFVGVDVARQHIHIAITDFKGNLKFFVQDIEFVLQSNADSFKLICGIVKDVTAKQGISWDSVLGVGVSLSGRVNPEEGYSLTYFVRDDLPLKAIFQNELKVPVNIENDSRAMTFGEYLYDEEARHEDNMLFINLSWGLGMGMILDGKLYYGKSGFSGEIGHFPLLDNDMICRCGKIGCLETGASGSALHRIIIDELKAGKASCLSSKFLTDKGITLEDILNAIKEEDVLSIEAMGRVGEALGRGIAGLINIFNPGLVVVGGRLIVGGDYLMFPIKTAVKKQSLNKVSSDTTIRFSKLGRKAAGIGDCLIARSKFLGLMK
jgi:predicted NBD/HSP70 family sugar kinase